MNHMHTRSNASGAVEATRSTRQLYAGRIAHVQGATDLTVHSHITRACKTRRFTQLAALNPPPFELDSFFFFFKGVCHHQ